MPRCPKGTRKNKKTGECEPYEKKKKEKSAPASKSKSKSASKSKTEKKKRKPKNKKLILEQDVVCNDFNRYSATCNNIIQSNEISEREQLEDSTDNILYPSLNDPNFVEKISKKREFHDTQIDGTIHENIKEHSDKLSKMPFELEPHQNFVRNFMSFQTPYNSLLLYHGLGTGKTCSAIGICEEMRDYMKQIGLNKKIIFIASENVQDNFKNQLFDENKLVNRDGLWSSKTCAGNKIIHEINPTNIKNIPKEKIVSMAKTLITNNYSFYGYEKFANYIHRVLTNNAIINDDEIKITPSMVKSLKRVFNGSLIVIDEVHNIRTVEKGDHKHCLLHRNTKDDRAKKQNIKNSRQDCTPFLLETLVKYSDNVRLLLLSATPMYNSYKEIIWLLNLMNSNDKKSIMNMNDVFTSNGEIKQGGKELIARKATGYISFVKGENPYTFPYRVYPIIFNEKQSVLHYENKYPKYQFNLKKISEESRKRIIDIYLNQMEKCNGCGNCQSCIYKYIVNYLKRKENTRVTNKGEKTQLPGLEDMESFGYSYLQGLIQSLIISFPYPEYANVIRNVPKVNYNANSDANSNSISSQTIVENIDENIDENIESKSDDKIDDENQIYNNKGGSSVDVAMDGDVSKDIEDNIDVEFDSQDENIVSPDDLFGKKGLSRVVNFEEIVKPPFKGNYEYNENYDRFFSHKSIGKYSIKIKAVLDNIYNSLLDKPNDGIILIYSQYIDSGLIPMALALEEYGFTRFGKNTKSLFKEPPTSIVDVRTMKPLENRNDFMPARYSLITGDSRFSPDNNFEVKALTKDENKDGNKVKIILISRSGSEGIDLKFIRQVHILDPWYNMNRIEQIIGRSVRNKSHKELPFEKRNVQIFMHGTLLDNNVEETADMYLYRVAEYKATQIGQITRILKENSVDCILNAEQQNFSEEKMNIEVEQFLSNHMTVPNFKVGDKPFSSNCDFMETCEYSCQNDNKLDELNYDTYNENFINTNITTIINKIKQLFTTHFFYDKDTLVYKINIIKHYPLIQIFGALTYLIENQEIIIDKFGREGRLVNIDNLYLFQPSEINNINIPLIERSIPVDFKHNKIDILINDDLKQEQEQEQEQDYNVINTINKTIAFIDNPYIENNNEDIIGDKNWYIDYNKILPKLIENLEDYENYKMIFLISHIIDNLGYIDKKNLLEYIYSLSSLSRNSIEFYIRDFFDKNISFIIGSSQYVFLYESNDVLNIFKITGKKIEKLDDYAIKNMTSKDEFVNIKLRENINSQFLIGFYFYEKNNNNRVFKMKEMKSSKDRDTGARCIESNKNTIMSQINRIVNKELFNTENTKLIKDNKGNRLQEKITRGELCAFAEMALRFYEETKYNGERWFLNLDNAVLSNVWNLFVNKSNMIVDKSENKNKNKKDDEPKRRGRKPKK
jgi:superfamily II DNA or RNA helicase